MDYRIAEKYLNRTYANLSAGKNPFIKLRSSLGIDKEVILPTYGLKEKLLLETGQTPVKQILASILAAKKYREMGTYPTWSRKINPLDWDFNLINGIQAFSGIMPDHSMGSLKAEVLKICSSYKEHYKPIDTFYSFGRTLRAIAGHLMKLDGEPWIILTPGDSPLLKVDESEVIKCLNEELRNWRYPSDLLLIKHLRLSRALRDIKDLNNAEKIFKGITY